MAKAKSRRIWGGGALADRISGVGAFGALRLLLPAAILAASGLGIGTSSALAYGSADNPLAQITVSANCDNPAFPLCASPPNGVGTGGIWYWIEVDGNFTGDMTGAACGHTTGGIGGPGGAGAGSIAGPVVWSYTSLAAIQAANGAITLIPGATDPNDHYYLVTLTIGEQWAFPTTPGHYSFQPVAGVTVQINVAT